MKIFYSLVCIFALFLTANAQASVISVNASADMTSGLPFNTALLPLGTNVTSDVTFDIGAGTLFNADLTNAAGTFSWVDTTFGAQLFNVNTVALGGVGSAGNLSFRFEGNGPTLNGVTATSFTIQFNAGTNPFTSTSDLFDLVLNSSIDRFRFGAQSGNTTHFGNIESNVRGTITAAPVPTPAGFLLFVSGLLALFAGRVKKNA